MSRGYDAIAEQLLAMKDEAGNWKPCWHHCALTMPQNVVTGRLYQGVNVISLWVGAQLHGYASSLWATYKQWEEKGCQVRKGEKGTPIVFYGTSTKEDEQGSEKRFRFARSSWVFNADQVDGWDGSNANMSDLSEDDRLALADAFVGGTGAKVFHSPVYDPPHFQPATDSINMPPFGQFVDPQGYYSVIFHELTHWTAGKGRLERECAKRYHVDKDARAMEELIAELGAAFLCADLEITNEPRADHATYLKAWHARLKNDVPAFMHAVSEASKAAQYLHQLQVPHEQAA